MCCLFGLRLFVGVCRCVVVAVVLVCVYCVCLTVWLDGCSVVCGLVLCIMFVLSVC